MGNSTYPVAREECICTDCGKTIARGEVYKYTKGYVKKVKKPYRYCMLCEPKHNRKWVEGVRAQRLYEALQKEPMFSDEILSTGVIDNPRFLTTAYALLRSEDNRVRKFNYVMRRHYGCAGSSVNFLIYWLEGDEIKVLKKIVARFGKKVVRVHWRDLIIPLFGKEAIKINSGSGRKVLQDTQSKYDAKDVEWLNNRLKEVEA